MVARDKESGNLEKSTVLQLSTYTMSLGEFYDDFSGADCPKGNCYTCTDSTDSLSNVLGSLRGLLGLPLTDVIEVVPSSHINYEVIS